MENSKGGGQAEAGALAECDECGTLTWNPEAHGTKYRHLPCGGKWTKWIELATPINPQGEPK